MWKRASAAPVAWIAAGMALLAAPCRADDAWSVRLADRAAGWGVSLETTFGDPERSVYIHETIGPGAAIFDFDGDGLNDIFVINGTTLEMAERGEGPPPHLYRNNGDGTFTEMAAKAGLTRSGWGQGVCVGDFDNDGHPDLFAAYYGYNTLWRNRGDGTFEDVTAKAKLPASGVRWGAGCAFADFDNNGYLDLFVSNYVDLDLARTPLPGEAPHCRYKGAPVVCGPRGLPRALNALYRNNGDGTFTDVSKQAGILEPGGRYGLGVAAIDFDNDGWPDIYVACDMTPSLLYRNKGDGTFEEIGSLSGAAFNVDGQLQAGMGVAVADYDGDGLLDIAKTNFSGDLPSLYRNEGGMFFEDIAQPAGLGANQLLGWGVVFLDADEDGWPDLMMVNGHFYSGIDASSIGESYRQPALIYRNLGDGRFADMSKKSGPDLQVPRPSRGLAVGDLTGDGRPELVVTNMNGRPTVFQIEGPRQSFLWLRLEGAESNRSAIGARAEVEAGGRKQLQEVVGGGSFFSQSDLALHFGLGKAAKIERLNVRWPSGKEQTFEDVEPSRRYKLREGGKLVDVVN